MGPNIAIEIVAPASRVWMVLTDVESWPLWTPSVTSVVRLDKGALAVGSRVRIKSPKTATAVWTVSEFRPEESFTWQSSRPGLLITAGHHVHSREAEAVTLTLTLDLAGPLGPIVEHLTAKAARRNVQLEAEGHKRRSEERS
jgi:uncharacterized membrane protein